MKTEADMGEKELLEEFAIKYFINQLSRIENNPYTIVEHTDKPDFIIQNEKSREILAVEIAHLYYDQEEAKMIFGRSKRKVHSGEYGEMYIQRLNSLIADKIKKYGNYDFAGNIILVIRVTSRVFDLNLFRQYYDLIEIPGNMYSQICLIDLRGQDMVFLKR